MARTLTSSRVAQVKGVRFFNHFWDIAKELPDALSEIVEESTEDLAADAKSRAPVDTGALRDSMEVRYRRSKGAVVRGRVLFTARNEQGAPYPMFVETGTVDTPAQPFLVPAAEDVRGSFLKKLSNLEERLPK